MSISGNLKTMEPMDLLQWLSDRRKTGALVIDDGKVEKRIFFRVGKIVSSASTDPKEYLSHQLLSHGLVTEQELAAVLETQEEEGGLLGQILVQGRGFSAEDLEELLRLKTEETIFDLFSWQQGEFRFHDGETLGEEMAELQLDVTGLTLQGARRLDEWERIREVIPSRRCIPVAIASLDALELPPREMAVLALVDDSRSIHEICLETRSSEFFVCETLFRQIRKRRVKVVRPPEPTGFSSDLLGYTGVTLLDCDALLRAAQQHLGEAAWERALRYSRAARSLEPDSDKVKAEVQATEAKIRQVLEDAGVVATAVPKLARPMEKLSSLKLSPEAGFILSRINGTYDMQSIYKITPMPHVDTGLLVLRLLEAEHITLEGGDT